MELIKVGGLSSNNANVNQNTMFAMSNGNWKAAGRPCVGEGSTIWGGGCVLMSPSSIRPLVKIFTYLWPLPHPSPLCVIC